MHQRPKEHYWLWYSLLWKMSKQFHSLVTCMCYPDIVGRHNRRNLSFGLFLFIARNTVLLLFRETGNMYGFKLWMLSPLPFWMISRAITMLLKATDFPSNFVAKITSPIPSCLSISVCSALCAWNKMKLLTTAISMRWKNKVFHHSTHFRWVLNVERIWSDLSTAFIFML